MKKFVIALAALAAVSTGALAAGSSVKFEGDHAYYPPKAATVASTGASLVSPLQGIDVNGMDLKAKSGVIGAIDEHTDAWGFSR